MRVMKRNCCSSSVIENQYSRTTMPERTSMRSPAGRCVTYRWKYHLRALALVRRRQRRDPANTRIETLGDPLDDPAFSGGVAPLENHDDLELVVQDPVLQFDQLALQAEKLLEIDASDTPPDGRNTY
jgi:hypothetical protein